MTITMLRIFALAIWLVGSSHACTELCSKAQRLSRLNRFAMCDLKTNSNVCVLSPFVERRKRNGYSCGPCSTQLQQVQCLPNEIVALANVTETTTLHLPITKPPRSLSSLCSIWLVSESGARLPIARSYDGHPWEPYRGPYASLKMVCENTQCTVQLPALDSTSRKQYGSYRYEVVAFERPIPESSVLAARFLEQATFGPTLESIWQFQDPAQWILSQMQQPASSHRQYYRERLNHRFEYSSAQGVITHACHVGTRYRKYAFSDKDRDAFIEIRTVAEGKLFLINGQERTVVQATKLAAGSANGNEFVDGFYQLCSTPTNSIGAPFRLRHNNRCDFVHDSRNVRIGIPPVFFDSTPQLDLPVLSLDGSVTEWDNFNFPYAQELMVVQPLTDASCDTIPFSSGNTSTIMGIYKGEYWIHDSRFTLRENSLTQPLENGAGDLVQATARAPEAYQVSCASVSPSFENEQFCRLSFSNLSACSTGEALDSETVELSVANFQKAHVAGDRYIFAVTGLRQENVPYPPPCSPGATSRWVLVAGSECDAFKAGNETLSVFQNILSRSSDTHPFLRDIIFPTFGISCTSADALLVDFAVRDTSNQCWKNTHPSNFQVYDFTGWTKIDGHPGGPAAIKQFAIAGNYTLNFPSWHGMSRWYTNYKTKLTELGRVGDTVSVLANPAVSESFDSILLSEVLEGSQLVCGSPFEVATNPVKGNTIFRGGFDGETEWHKTTSSFDLVGQRTSIWLQMALKADDQLRQKIAWVLSQILVVAPSSIDAGSRTELFLHYYDIFVRNAFGSYRDILKEVAYSPLMAEMLSYHDSRSTAYVWNRHRRHEFADENFAREIMQLFSIGLHKLNPDGTVVTNSNGLPVAAYSNDDITEYARLWTGFVRQPKRGNIERGWKNEIDPMRIEIQKRDYSPKMGLNDLYIGDHYPLCSDLPQRHFLRKGAEYRLLGTVPTPRLLGQHSPWITDHSIHRLRLSSSSPLFAALCNPDNSKACRYQGVVQLQETLTCNGIECEVDSPRIIEVEAGLYYEYTRPPCVEQSFYSNGVMLKTKSTRYFCGNPRLESGTVGCCSNGSNRADVNYVKFNGELVKFATAKQRCAAKNLDLCDNPWMPCDTCDPTLGYWTKRSCTPLAKISLDGKVAIVHKADGNIDANRIVYPVREDTKTYFRVKWTAGVDKFVQSYEKTCSDLGCTRDSFDNLCVCPTNVTEQMVFKARPTREQVLDELKIGAFAPDKGQRTVTNLGGGIIMHSIGVQYSESTIFEVVDDNGVTHFRKNVRSTVSVGNGSMPLSFRNPPHFVNLGYPEIRDAAYETDAGLDHYLYHKNAAPFLAIRFIQRFGISNPSPRLVSVVATAFRQGRYDALDSSNQVVSFGSGFYGDLGAMVAAILLDRESRSLALDMDPAHGSVLEPMAKFVRVLRSLEFEADRDDPHIRIGVDLQDLLGQQPHKLPSVFSFFLPEYSPSGPVGNAGLVCPECMVLNAPNTVALSNGINSLLKYGLDSAFEGFGIGRSTDERLRVLGASENARGHLTYSPSVALNSSQVIDELALLLTSGRLLDEQRDRMIQIYDQLLVQSSTRQGALIHLQQVMVSTPEFHTNTISRSTGKALPKAESEVSAFAPGDYKAVIFLMLDGGADSYNMLVPHTCTGKNAAGLSVDQQYATERGNLAFTAEERTLIIDVDAGQPCRQFAIHDELKLLKTLYDDGDLTFFANTGMLDEAGVDNSNYQFRTKLGLFAHNTMTKSTQTVDPKSNAAGSGVLGRLSSRLAQLGYATSSISIDRASFVTESERGDQQTRPVIASRKGPTIFDRKPSTETFNLQAHVEEFNSVGKLHSSLFGSTWSEQIVKGTREASTMKSHLDSVSLENHWPLYPTRTAEKFAMVSKFILSRDVRKKNREVFFTDIAGWDHHDNMKTNLRTKLSEVNQGLTLLVQELKTKGVWNNVTIVVASDFGRTLTPNSGGGSDHAWGGHYWMMGGDVKGRNILGKYPSDLTASSPLNAGRGRIIPTTSWDSIWNGVAEWMGASSDADFDYCLPNRHAASGDGFTDLFRAKDLFQSFVV